jgi:hypothetical protein
MSRNGLVVVTGRGAGSLEHASRGISPATSAMGMPRMASSSENSRAGTWYGGVEVPVVVFGGDQFQEAPSLHDRAASSRGPSACPAMSGAGARRAAAAQLVPAQQGARRWSHDSTLCSRPMAAVHRDSSRNLTATSPFKRRPTPSSPGHAFHEPQHLQPRDIVGGQLAPGHHSGSLRRAPGTGCGPWSRAVWNCSGCARPVPGLGLSGRQPGYGRGQGAGPCSLMSTSAGARRPWPGSRAPRPGPRCSPGRRASRAASLGGGRRSRRRPDSRPGAAGPGQARPARPCFEADHDFCPVRASLRPNRC